MDLINIDFVKLLPQFMRDDDAVNGLAAGINSIISALGANIKKLSTWDHIDELSEPELDALAWELNIFWYDSSASIEVKRELIKNSDLVYKRLGTKWAVENVVKSYFGNGYVYEWFEYEGTPGHFKVISTTEITSEQYSSFIRVLSQTKRASAILDDIIIALFATWDYYEYVRKLTWDEAENYTWDEIEAGI